MKDANGIYLTGEVDHNNVIISLYKTCSCPDGDREHCVFCKGSGFVPNNNARIIARALEEQARIDALMTGEGPLEVVEPAGPIDVLRAVVAVCQNWSLVMDRLTTTVVFKELKGAPEMVPEKFKQYVELFHVERGQTVPISDTVDRFLKYPGRPIATESVFPNKERFILEDSEARAYLESYKVTPEEWDWLWGLAQELHQGSSPVLRRTI